MPNHEWYHKAPQWVSSGNVLRTRRSVQREKRNAEQKYKDERIEQRRIEQVNYIKRTMPQIASSLAENGNHSTTLDIHKKLVIESRMYHGNHLSITHSDTREVTLILLGPGNTLNTRVSYFPNSQDILFRASTTVHPNMAGWDVPHAIHLGEFPQPDTVDVWGKLDGFSFPYVKHMYKMTCKASELLALSIDVNLQKQFEERPFGSN